MRGHSDLSLNRLLQGKIACLCGFDGQLMQAVETRFIEEGARVTRGLPGLLAEESKEASRTEPPREASAPPVDCLVFILPPLWRKPLEETGSEAFHQGLEEGPVAAWRAVQAVLPGMMARCAGTVVFIGSDLAVEGVPFTSGYAAAAGALDGLMRAAAMDVGRYGIRCNAVLAGMNIAETGDVYKRECPQLAVGDFAGLQPVHRRGTPLDVAEAALYLASDLSGFLTGESLPVNGGILAVAHVQDWR